MSRVSLGTRLTESMLATSAPVLRHSFRTVAVFVFAAPFAVATPAIEARRTSDKIRAEIVGKENWHARGGGEQVAFKQFLPDVDRPRGELLCSWRGRLAASRAGRPPGRVGVPWRSRCRGRSAASDKHHGPAKCDQCEPHPCEELWWQQHRRPNLHASHARRVRPSGESDCRTASGYR